ncbi:MAG: hypothetical protein K0R81_2673 [Microbacterium sp.]|jgi:hypothetical protein|nr:hypothetical protein [Microbacterium sp.]
MRRRVLLRAGLALALLGGLVAAPAAAAGPDEVIVTVPGPREGGASGDGTIVDAQLRWGLNAETGGGAFAGGCNFLSAGVAGDAGGARVWNEGDGLYRSEDGRVRIEKPTADGGWTTASWATKCLDANGSAVSVASTASTSGNQVVIDGGTGARRDGSVEILWSGSFTVVFYGGMTYWSVTDPRLTLDASGTGQLVGTASGYGTSMDDMTTWNPIAPQTIVLADIRAADLSAAGGFVVTPQYLGVLSVGSGQIARSGSNEAHWGAFPQSFLDFHRLTGQQGYWLTTGGVRDAAKPASPLTVSYSSSAPILTPVPAPAGASAAGTPDNPLRRAPAALAAAAPLSQMLPVSTPLTTQPQAAGLVPEARQTLSALVLPLLGSAAALGAAIIAVLSMMRAFPWQRRSTPV